MKSPFLVNIAQKALQQDLTCKGMKKFTQGKPFFANFVTKASVWKITLKCMKGRVRLRFEFQVEDINQYATSSTTDQKRT